MRMSFSTRVGLLLVFAGAATYAGVQHWMQTRIIYPLNIPISLAQGHIRTPPFRLNLRTDYEVIVAIPYSPQWEQSHPECNPYRHLQTRTTLYRGGKIIDQQGQPTMLPWPTFFSASSGMYELDFEVLNDFRCVDSIHPNLEIIARAEDYESAVFAIEVAAIMAMYVGLCTLVFIPILRTGARTAPPIKITDSTTIDQNVQWAQKLPLRPPITGLPGFGLVGGVLFAILAMIMMMLTAPIIPKGLWVHLLKPGAVPATSDGWAAPLIVRVKDDGAGKEPLLYVNSKRVSWEEFSQVLKQELSLRRDWTVYVEGDDAVAWGNVATVIDIARGYHANVYFFTGNSGKKRRTGSETLIWPIARSESFQDAGRRRHGCRV